jgi:hypothetical protein
MYDWKDIALMYKEESNKLCDEVHEVLEHISAKAPHSIVKAEKILKNCCSNSDKQLAFIESFEASADSNFQNPAKETPPPKEAPKEKNKLRAPLHHHTFTEKELEAINMRCSKITNTTKQAYEIVNQCGMLAVKRYFNLHNLTTTDFDIDYDNHVVTVAHKELKVEKTIKVVVSGMKFGGKTRAFGSEDELKQVPLQHTFLINPKEKRYHFYMFVVWNNKEKKATVYARIPNRLIDSMLVDPLRERFIGKRSCILQTQGYNNGIAEPYAIDEMVNRR